MVLDDLTGISVGIATESITATDQSTATLNLSKDAHKVNVSGVATIDCQGGTEYETHILTIENTGIATVIYTYFYSHQVQHHHYLLLVDQ